VLAETISRVLYPDDSTDIGKELRLKQEFFFTSASLQDLMRRFLAHNGDLRALPSKVAIQMNDTHPAIAGARVDPPVDGCPRPGVRRSVRDRSGTLHYTNHTLLPEALESWDIASWVAHPAASHAADRADRRPTWPRREGVPYGCQIRVSWRMAV
jgi:starch phosphorylase